MRLLPQNMTLSSCPTFFKSPKNCKLRRLLIHILLDVVNIRYHRLFPDTGQPRSQVLSSKMMANNEKSTLVFS